MENKTDLVSTNREDIVEYVKGIIHEVLKGKNCDIYLFGSWARKEEKRTSDIDIAIDSNKKIPD